MDATLALALKPLRPMHQRFVLELLRDPTGNGAEAARRAGYSVHTAREQAHDLLSRPHIQAAVQAARKQILARLELSAERVLAEVAALAFSRLPGDLVQWEASGETTFTPTEELTDEQKAAVARVYTAVDKDGVRRVSGIVMHQKIHSLELLGRYLGLWGKSAQRTNLFDESLLLAMQGTYRGWLERSPQQLDSAPSGEPALLVPEVVEPSPSSPMIEGDAVLLAEADRDDTRPVREEDPPSCPPTRTTPKRLLVSRGVLARAAALVNGGTVKQRDR